MDIRPIDANGINVKRWFVFPDNRKTMTEALEAAPTLSLNTLRDEIYEDAVVHGLWEGAEYETDKQMGVQMYHAACRISEEVYELKDEARIACSGKENGYSEELADLIILSLSIAGHFNIDIDAAIRRKMEINKNRSYKHAND